MKYDVKMFFLDWLQLSLPEKALKKGNDALRYTNLDGMGHLQNQVLVSNIYYYRLKMTSDRESDTKSVGSRYRYILNDAYLHIYIIYNDYIVLFIKELPDNCCVNKQLDIDRCPSIITLL